MGTIRSPACIPDWTWLKIISKRRHPAQLCPMIRLIKILVFVSCLVPLGLLAWKFFGAHPSDVSTWGVGLGANPVEALEHKTGDWTLRFLLITLSITPLRKLLRV